MMNLAVKSNEKCPKHPKELMIVWNPMTGILMCQICATEYIKELMGPLPTGIEEDNYEDEEILIDDDYDLYDMDYETESSGEEESSDIDKSE